jgi:HEAT repeat protein
LPEPKVVSGLVSYLESSKNTIRRSAIYALQNGGFADIAPAAAALQRLLMHQEDLTRGMAALALGQNHVKESFETLAKMTREDSSGYARRCAAYALGLMGDPRAEPTLQAALNDAEAMVRNNAQAALAMLSSAKTPRDRQR